MQPDEVGTVAAEVTMTEGPGPPTEGLTPVVRTDFTDGAAWQSVVAGITAPGEEFTPEEVGLDPSEGPQFARADVRFIERTDLDGATPEEVVADLRKTSDESFAFIVDRTTITDAEHPILCVDFSDEPPVTFRFVPSQSPAVQNNLELANMEAAEFADAADPDGIFRGFDGG